MSRVNLLLIFGLFAAPLAAVETPEEKQAIQADAEAELAEKLEAEVAAKQDIAAQMAEMRQMILALQKEQLKERQERLRVEAQRDSLLALEADRKHFR